MSHHDHSGTQSDSRVPRLARIAFFVFIGIAAFFLVTEHTAHVFGVLPFLLIAICPLLHMGGHGRHRGHGDHRDNGATNDDQSTPTSASDATSKNSTHRH